MSKLYIVPTPIGNLKDMTFRAVEVLKEVNLILAEDTRTSGKLLKHYEVDTRIRSYHMHNEHSEIEKILNEIQSGISIALISDAGTPAISDPGYLLSKACVENGVEVECLPGATAFVPALVNSGLPNEKFVFEGFLPQKKGRQTRLEILAQEKRTFILYESPHRLVKTLAQLSELLGEERRASVSRELTKMFEENKQGTLKELIKYFSAKTVKGEIVLVVAGLPQEKKEKNKSKNKYR